VVLLRRKDQVLRETTDRCATMLTTGAGAIREPAARNLRPVALKVPNPSTDALAAARRKMLIELLTERIRMTSSVNVIVTSRARGSRNSREKRRRLALSEWPRSRSHRR